MYVYHVLLLGTASHKRSGERVVVVSPGIMPGTGGVLDLGSGGTCHIRDPGLGKCVIAGIQGWKMCHSRDPGRGISLMSGIYCREGGGWRGVPCPGSGGWGTCHVRDPGWEDASYPGSGKGDGVRVMSGIKQEGPLTRLNGNFPNQSPGD